MAEQPPDHVKRAASVVEQWVREQEQRQAAPADPFDALSPSEKWARMRAADQSKMPGWKDPRT
jgi:hypothetical protein